MPSFQGRCGPAPDYVIRFGPFYDFWLHSWPAATMPVVASCVNPATATDGRTMRDMASPALFHGRQRVDHRLAADLTDALARTVEIDRHPQRDGKDDGVDAVEHWNTPPRMAVAEADQDQRQRRRRQQDDPDRQIGRASCR